MSYKNDGNVPVKIFIVVCILIGLGVFTSCMHGAQTVLFMVKIASSATASGHMHKLSG